MANDVGMPGAPLSIEARLAIAANHEAGHIVIAAVEGLRLRPEGIMVDTEAEGLATWEVADKAEALKEGAAAAHAAR